MNDLNDGMIGKLPKNINKEVPTPTYNAQNIVKLVKHSGEVVGYELANGQRVSKEEGIAMAKEGGILGVAVATRNGDEYLRTLPDGADGNNLSSLPTVSE